MHKESSLFETARRRLMYTVSLPERTVRSLAALIGGTSALLAETLFPKSLQGTTTYKVTIGLMQQFIVERVAGMKSEVSERNGHVHLGEDYVQRKMAGTALEAAGLLTIGYSPLWVFAILGDAAGGSRVFLNRLVKYLKENDVVNEDIEAAELVDVLEAVQEALSKSASTIDTPPLSRKELSELANEMNSNYGRVAKSASNLMPRLEAIWNNMEQLALRENISIERLVGIMTVDAATWSKKGMGMALATGQASTELFNEKILDSYRETLATTSVQGVDEYLRDHMRPFMQAARAHFDPTRKTWTETKLVEESKERQED
jgi:hypothetical protein